MSYNGNFFIDQEREKWRRVGAYLNGQKNVEFITINDLTRDTGYQPHEILNPLAAAGVPLVCAENNRYRIRDILRSLDLHKVGNRG